MKPLDTRFDSNPNYHYNHEPGPAKTEETYEDRVAQLDARLAAHKENCLHGKHIWATWGVNDIVDPLTFQHTGRCTMLHTTGTVFNRGCIICGFMQQSHTVWT